MILHLNNVTLQKWHMKNTPLEIDKYGSPNNGALKKAHLAKKLWSWNFKIEFFPLQSDKTITFLYLIVGV